MSVSPDVRPILLVNEIGLHLSHSKIHFLAVYQSNAGAISVNVNITVTTSFSDMLTLAFSRHECYA